MIDLFDAVRFRWMIEQFPNALCYHIRVISRNLKLGGIGNDWGRVNMRDAQIYIKKH